jgi:hypothetical protein
MHDRDVDMYAICGINLQAGINLSMGYGNFDLQEDEILIHSYVSLNNMVVLDKD